MTPKGKRERKNKMSEYKENPNAQAKQQAQAAANELRALLDAPMTEAEAAVAMAEIDVRVRQLEAMRCNIDQQLAAESFNASVIRRRVLNGKKDAEKPAGMGEPVGPGETK